MKKLTLFVFIFTFLCVFAQDYQTIRSNQVHYFGTDAPGYFLATRTDSVEMSGNDSIFYSFKTLRLIDQTNDFELGPNWYGSKVIVKSNGENLFFNKDNDTIFILTQAILTDTFTIYTYPNGDWIKGWVSSITEETILGQLDSIKTISLFSNSINFQINLPEFKLGKHSGLTTIFPFYSFPETYLGMQSLTDLAVTIQDPMKIVGSEYPKIGITRQTVGDIYNYEIGDKINYYNTTYNNNNSTYGGSRVNLIYTGKTQWNNDSIKYDYESKADSYFYDDLNGIEDYNFYPTNSVSTTYYKLDSFIHQSLPEEVIIDTIDFIHNGVFTTLRENVNCQNLLVETLYNEELMYDNSTGHFTYGFSYPKKYVYNEKGGGPYLSGSDYLTNVMQSGILFQSNQNGSCGDEWYLTTDEKDTKAPLLKVYPNPFSDQITLKISANNTENCTIVIYNLQGQIIHDYTASNNQFKGGTIINLSHVAPGQYILEVNDKSYYSRQIITKQ